jgi:antitoxin ParD1/3/4
MIAAHRPFLIRRAIAHNAATGPNGKAYAQLLSRVAIIATMRGKELFMSNVEKVSVALSSDLLDMVKKAVATGEYASTSEVIREALRDWKLRQPLRQAEVERLRQAWAEGLSSGETQPFDIEEIKRRARNRIEGANLGTSRRG